EVVGRDVEGGRGDDGGDLEKMGARGIAGNGDAHLIADADVLRAREFGRDEDVAAAFELRDSFLTIAAEKFKLGDAEEFIGIARDKAGPGETEKSLAGDRALRADVDQAARAHAADVAGMFGVAARN